MNCFIRFSSSSLVSYSQLSTTLYPDHRTFLSNTRVSFISMQSFSFLFWNTCMTMLIASIVMKMNCFGGIIDRRKVLSLISIDRNYQILTIANLRHTANSICTFPKSEFSLCWMKLWNSGNHYTTAPYYLL